jgi:hypothetical protein
VAVVVLLSYPTHLLLELQQAVLVAQVTNLQVEQEAHQLLLTQAEQVVAVAVSLPLAATLQVTQVELAEMAGAGAGALTTLEHLVLVATAFFIFTTKRKKQWQHTQ